MNLPLLPHDKANHLAYSAAIASVMALVTPLWVAAVACVGLALGKELIDYVGQQGTPDAWDAVASIAGGTLVLLPLYVRSVA